MCDQSGDHCQFLVIGSKTDTCCSGLVCDPSSRKCSVEGCAKQNEDCDNRSGPYCCPGLTCAKNAGSNKLECTDIHSRSSITPRVNQE